jgi:hypothetical protein
LLLLVPLTLSALEKEPWFGNLWEFQLDTSYSYGWYRHFSRAETPLRGSAYDQIFYADLAVSPTPDSRVDIDVEMAHTSRRPWGFQSMAGQYRLLWLDDVIGDPLSLSTGISFRGVNSRSLRDVNAPYHSYLNGEISLVLGKEWENPPYWRFRSFIFGALGMANRGAPWSRFYLSFQSNQQDRRRWEIFSAGYFGFGGERRVNIDHFHSYAHIHHQSIDLGIAYRYLFRIWGTLSLEYAYRLYARSFPEHTNFLTLRYQLPFSLF